ncbi:hypothetical protein C5167_045439 [Papaver somniferum]|uniref:Tubby C-terminal domain-containing protein n=1 Tax=Papaver somniferum TaxID=3469 RepID=A0A4Y7LAW4_PAPSO|nr:protein LURP-one-related 8-like [Papaver somniferum]RZC82654.1 hypothetical protein C5167_045439 [Papaver somniferum]
MPKKIYPNSTTTAAAATESTRIPKQISDKQQVEVLTVWKKSLLFNCNGFTVFDTNGNLVFRVDNYRAGNKTEIFLMDASGKTLLTIRRKKLSLTDNWMVFDGETSVNPRFLVKKPVNFLTTKDLAHVISCQGNSKELMYEIIGSYAQRCVAVYDSEKRLVGEIQRKEAKAGVTFGGDVFKLIVQPEFDQAVAMALVILMEQMFGLKRSSSLGRLG